MKGKLRDMNKEEMVKNCEIVEEEWWNCEGNMVVFEGMKVNFVKEGWYICEGKKV